MKRVRVVGLTGGMGCGKSSAAAVLVSDGVPVLDTDRVAHDLLQPGTEALEMVLSVFGRHFAVDGKLDRKMLGSWVFPRPQELARLNAIMHPLIFDEMHRWLEGTLVDHEHAVVVIPLLFETGAERWCDRVMVIAADEATVLQRLESRGWSRADVLLRMRSQMALGEKTARADAVVWNNGSLDELAGSVRREWKRLILGKEAKT